MFVVVLCHNQIITIMENIYVLSVGDYDRYFANLNDAIKSAKTFEERFDNNICVTQVHREIRDYNMVLVGSMNDRWKGELGTNKYGRVNVIIKCRYLN